MPRMIITIDFGPNASIGALASVIGDVSQVMDFGLVVDQKVAEWDAAQEVERLWRNQPDALLERIQSEDETAYTELRSLVNERNLWEEFLNHGPFPPDLIYEEWYRFRRRIRGQTSSPFLTSSLFSSPYSQFRAFQDTSPGNYCPSSSVRDCSETTHRSGG